MCVLCMFYVDWELEWQKKIKGREIWRKKIVGVGLQVTNYFFKALLHYYLVNLFRILDIP